MTLAQLWSRRLWGGILAAAFVPAVLLTALAVSLLGGLGGLGALGQAFTGPAVPAGATAQAVSQGGAQAPSAALAALAPSGRAGTASGRGGSVLGSPGSPASGSSGISSSVRGSRSAGTGNPGTGGGQLAADGSPHGPPPPRGHPTVIDGVVSPAAGVTNRLPGPAGEAATQTLVEAGSAINEILPLTPPKSR